MSHVTKYTTPSGKLLGLIEPASGGDGWDARRWTGNETWANSKWFPLKSEAEAYAQTGALPERSKMATRKNGPGAIYLLSTAPGRWDFFMGDRKKLSSMTHVHLSDEPRGFSSKKEAIAAAKRHGLTVMKSGLVEVSERVNPGVPPGESHIKKSHVTGLVSAVRAERGPLGSGMSGNDNWNLDNYGITNAQYRHMKKVFADKGYQLPNSDNIPSNPVNVLLGFFPVNVLLGFFRKYCDDALFDTHETRRNPGYDNTAHAQRQVDKVLTKMLNGYMEAALGTSTDESTPAGGDPLDKNFSTADFDAEAAAKMTRDIAKFFAANQDDIEEFTLTTGKGYAFVGHCFWLNRNGHGSGFWDRDAGDVGERLSKASTKFRECYIYVNDDGQLSVG